MLEDIVFVFKAGDGEVRGSNEFDGSDNPAGGWVQGKGLEIHWEDGPLGRGDERREPSGASVEAVVMAVIERMEFYQSSRLRCPENARTITRLQEAVHWMTHRTQDRELRGVEGTNQE